MLTGEFALTEQQAFNTLWLLFSSVLVLLMQAAFLCLESGMTRSKNAINVALKNVIDLLIVAVLYWLVGYSLMFGEYHIFGIDLSFLAVDFSQKDFWFSSFFIFQLTFCATAATIVSGAIAERSRFITYILLTVLISLFIYPMFGHWAWGGVVSATKGWLAQQGFIDFAGSTVVHSLGGWVSLAAIIIVGPRQGRFRDGKVQSISASNLPMAMLGLLFFIIGWIGFNGGSTLSFDQTIPGIIINTLLAATVGGLTAMLAGSLLKEGAAPLAINGTIAGLVSITAGCHVVSTFSAAMIGLIGSLFMLAVSKLLHHFELDDAIDAIPVHLASGVWGTLAVALFGNLARIGTGLSRVEQFVVQLEGVVLCGVWSFSLAFIFLILLRKFMPLRVTAEAESEGLNSAEHGASTELTDLLNSMNEQEQTGDMGRKMPVEPFTEVGQIADKYNRVLDKFNRMVSRTQLILKDMRDGVITFSAQGIITSINPGIEVIFGRTQHQLVGANVGTLLHSDNTKYFPEIDQGELFVKIASSHHEGPHEMTGCCGTGNPIPIEVITAASPTDEGVQYSAVIRDITERRKMEDRVHRHSQLAQVTLEAITEAVITCDENLKTVYINPMAERLINQSIENIFERPIQDVISLQQITGEAASVEELCRQSIRSQDYRQFRLINKNKQIVIIQFNCAPLEDAQGESMGWVIAMRDITQHSALQEQLSFQAVHDALTGLINRNEFERRLEHLVALAKNDLSQHVVCYLDLDQFKIVNDTCGHRAGDLLLQQLTNILKPLLRQSDTLARLGGDEFGILLNNCPLDRGIEIAELFRNSVKNFRFLWERQQFSVGASIGLVPFSAEYDSTDEILSLADSACYAAKDAGRNRVHVYHANDIELDARKGQMHWASRIQQAVDADRFRLFYQTIEPLNSKTEQPLHIEIFIRMLDENDELIPPGAFIPAAERYDLMAQVDQWVISNTLAWLGDYLRTNNQPVQCAINLSGVSIGAEACLNTIKQSIERHRVPAHYLCFEITETAAISDPDRACKFVEELKQLGCRFALDDFGSGLSSFGYLRSLPVDYLKIDGLFIRDITKSKVDQAMVASINNIAHIMGLETIAEFVEDHETIGLLRQIGVDFAQGYLISKPEPLERLGKVRLMPR